MWLPNMKRLKNLVAAKQAIKDTLLKLSHVGQMFVSIARPQHVNSAIRCVVSDFTILTAT